MLVSCSTQRTTSDTTSTTLNDSDQIVTLISPDFPTKAIVFSNLNTNSNAPTESVTNVPSSQRLFTSAILNTPSELSGKMKDFYSTITSPPKILSALTHSASHINYSISSNDDTYTFYAVNVNTNMIKTVDAALVYGDDSTTCLIYLQEGLDNTYNWNTIGVLFDETIYPRVSDKFGEALDVDNNDQIVILYSSFENNNIVGYFNPIDLFDTSGSNRMEILHMNYLTMNYPTLNYQTIAHEFQHLTNYSEAIRHHNGIPMDTWLNEGLAEAASHYALEYPIEEHIEAIQTSSTIANGLSVIDWIGTFNNYTLSYLFSEYLKNIATSGIDIFLDMILSDGDAITQVETAMSGENDDISTMEEFLAYFRLANVIQGDGIYGYGDDSDIFRFDTIPAPNNSNSTLNVPPGGSIVIYPSDADFDTFNPSSIGDNIIIYKVEGDE